MIKFTSLVKALCLPEELVLEILSYLPYTYYKQLIICDLDTYLYWANKQIKYKKRGCDPNYTIKYIGGVKHSIRNEPSLTLDQGYVYYKFDLMHNSHGPAQLYTAFDNTRTVVVWNKYGFTVRKVFTGDINHDYNYSYGLRHDEYYTHGRLNTHRYIPDTILDRITTIMTEMEKQIIELNFSYILYDKSTGQIGGKKYPTYTSTEGDIVYMYSGIIHKHGNLPAVIFKDGTSMYIKRGIIEKIVEPSEI